MLRKLLFAMGIIICILSCVVSFSVLIVFSYILFGNNFNMFAFWISTILFLCGLYMQKHELTFAYERKNVHGLTTLKCLCMFFVAIIHSECNDILERSFIFKKYVNTAVPLLMIGVGITSQLSHSNPVNKNIVTRIVKILPQYYVFLIITWSFKLLFKTDKIDSIYHTKMIMSSFLGYSPCIAGSWFVFPFFQILIISSFIENVTILHVLYAIFVSALYSTVENDVNDFINNYIDNFGCSLYGKIFSYSSWIKWIGYVVAGMCFAKYKYNIFLPNLCIISSILLKYSTIYIDNTLLQNISDETGTILFGFYVIYVFNNYNPHRYVSYIGNNSWTIYLGQIFALNVFIKSKTLCTFVDEISIISQSIVFIELAILCGVIFTNMLQLKNFDVKQLLTKKNETEEVFLGKHVV